MFEAVLSSAVAIDAGSETIHFFTTQKSKANGSKYEAESYRANFLDGEFMEKFAYILKVYREKNTADQMQKVSFVLPDRLFFNDTLNIPTLNKRATQHLLKIAVESLYRNTDDLMTNNFLLTQNKQSSTYGMVGIRKEMIAKIREFCAANQLSIGNITFAANATVNAALVMNSKLRSASFVLLDIKETLTRLVFVVGGKTFGAYMLPFGTNLLSQMKPFPEDMLFDHAAAELAVLNAEEKAQQRELTMAQITVPAKKKKNSANPALTLGLNGNPHKKARELPAFMLRPAPTNKDECVFENFRTIMKWTLDIIDANSAITSVGAPEAVYVNMPDSYGFLFDMVNAEAEENKITFAPLLPENTEPEIAENLELFGALYVKQFNKYNNF